LKAQSPDPLGNPGESGGVDITRRSRYVGCQNLEMAYLNKWSIFNLAVSANRGVAVSCRTFCGWKPLLWAGVGMAIVVGCYTAQLPLSVIAPPVDRLTESSASPSDLEAGREIYVSAKKCAHCHLPKPVFSFSKKEWAYAIMPKMGKKAELTHVEYDEVLAYVEAASSVQPAKTK
jgi:hypothetical protein